MKNVPVNRPFVHSRPVLDFRYIINDNRKLWLFKSSKIFQQICIKILKIIEQESDKAGKIELQGGENCVKS